MTILLMITALLAIAVIGAWGWLRHDQARKHAERRAREESERIAKEEVMAKAREEARLQAEAQERSRREAGAKENARLAEEQRLAAEILASEAEAKRLAEERALAEAEARETARMKAEAEAKQRADAEGREKARVAAEEEQWAEVRRQAETQAKAGAEAPPETPPPDKPPVEDREAIPAVVEVTERRESEAAPPNEGKPLRERAPLSPEDRGGRSREIVPKKEGGGEKKRRTRTPKPEIVCWKREREWILAVELPDDFPQRQNVSVVQDGKPLEIDETENGCWRLAQLHGEVVMRVTDAENQQVFTLPLGDDGCLIFKLTGEDRGRHVKRPGSGSCLAIVPQDWKRDEAMAGPPCIAPEDVCLSGYRAHFFEL